MRMKRTLTALLIVLCLVPACAAAEILELPIDNSGGMPLQSKFENGMMVYEDPSIRVERDWKKSDAYGCTYYVAYVKIANATQLRTTSSNGFNSNMRSPVAVMAKRVNAVLAFNGDYYAARSGVYVLRQGVVYRDQVEAGQDLLLIDEDGDFHIILDEEHPEDMDKTTVDGKRVVNGFAFGPALVKNGQKVYLDEDSCPNNTKPWERAQRIAIAQLGPLEYMVVACAKYGLAMDPFCDLIIELGGGRVQAAYNLDGGGSTQLIFMNKKVNNTDATNVRPVPDIIYFASAYAPD